MDPGRLTLASREVSVPSGKLTVSFETVISAFILMALVAAAVLGWWHRAKLPTPEHGPGYALGIAGVTMMVVLMVYPLRKRLASATWMGSVGAWFRIHMFLGLLGPLVILYHARFTWASTNSGVALLALLVVVASGLFGRFLYVHIHRGYSQRKLEVRDIFDELEVSRLLLNADGNAGHLIVGYLRKLEHRALERRPNMVKDALAVFSITFRTWLFAWRLRRVVRDELAREAMLPDKRAARAHVLLDHLTRYLRSIRDVGGFALYDRLFRAWHYLHLPLFLFLAMTVALHVLAVHMY
ncbi:hypothetical protein [Sphingopyxis fribergensis]